EPDREALAAALGADVGGERERDDREAEQHRWPLEAHRRPLARRNEANPLSQSPAVESTTWSAPARRSSSATASRSSAARAAKRSRSRRLPVSTRSWRPVSGSTSQRSPTDGSDCSRG